MFAIDTDNTILFSAEARGFPAGFGEFDNLQALSLIAEERRWSKQDVTDIWNSFAGTAGPFAALRPVKMFRNRPYGLTAIWKAIQRLKSATDNPGKRYRKRDEASQQASQEETRRQGHARIHAQGVQARGVDSPRVAQEWSDVAGTTGGHGVVAAFSAWRNLNHKLQRFR
jgi:hypothetical protein